MLTQLYGQHEGILVGQKKDEQTDLRVFSPQADVVDPGALCSKVLWDVNGEVLNVGKTSNPGKHDDGLRQQLGNDIS